QILKKLYPMAAGYGASVDKEMTIISGRVHKDNVNAFTDLLLDAILHPSFSADDFKRHQTDVINYLDKTLRYSNDEAFGKEMLYDNMFAGTPYGHPDEGLPASVRSITLDDVKNFYKANFTAGNVVVGIGGAFDAALVTRLTTALGTLPPGAPAAVAKPTPKMPVGKEVVLVDKDVKSTAISIGFPIDLKRGDPDFYALWIANSWLGEHRNSSSHLYNVIREKRGMNYGDYSYIEYYPNGWRRQFPAPNAPLRQQFFEIWLRPVSNDAAHFALRAALRELQKLVDNGMSEEEFNLTRTFVKKYVKHYAPTTDLRLGYKIDDAFYGISDHLKTAEQMFDKVTLDDVNKAIKKYLQTSNLRIAMIAKDAATLKQALVTDAPSPMTYATPKPPEVLEEDKVISVYPLKISANKVTIVPVDSTFMR
ncbi:MAG: insulinase family protein, partial [candidate division Zixibacteria bacterium]|nr:insulinase family protein [candidate division Zixibacteria bacterium]